MDAKLDAETEAFVSRFIEIASPRLLLALLMAKSTAGDDDPLRCRGTGEGLGPGPCPFRADAEDGYCTPCRLVVEGRAL